MKRDIYYIEVLGKAMQVLDAFARAPKPKLTLQEVTTLTRLNKNTVFRILYTLAEHGFVEKEDHGYEPGAKVLDLASARLRRSDLVAVAGPFLDALRDRFGETVNLGVLDGGSVRYVDVRESPESFRLAERVGGSDLLHCTALGKSLLARLPSAEVKRLMRRCGMPRRTPKTITAPASLEAELERVRERGYAVDAEESMAGAFCVGAPIVDQRGAPVAALSISGPLTRFGEKHLASASKAVVEAAAAIRARLGFQG